MYVGRIFKADSTNATKRQAIPELAAFHFAHFMVYFYREVRDLGQ